MLAIYVDFVIEFHDNCLSRKSYLMGGGKNQDSYRLVLLEIERCSQWKRESSWHTMLLFQVPKLTHMDVNNAFHLSVINW